MYFLKFEKPGGALLFVFGETVECSGYAASVFFEIFQEWEKLALAIWEGGLVWYGGFIGATLAVIIFSRKHGIPFFCLGDAMAPGTFLGLTMGGFGCLAAGDDFGRPILDEAWKQWGVIFTRPDALIYPDSLKGVSLHPTQLYMVSTAFLLFLLLNWLLKRKRFDGQVISIAFLLYPIGRTIVEHFRGDSLRGYVVPGILSTSQFISLFVVIWAIVMFVRQRKTEPQLTLKRKFSKA